MKDRVSNDIGAGTGILNWATINWKLIKKRVRNLRQRIYRASQNKQWKRVRSLMKLMLKSYSNLLLAVRRVTQENQGKRTAGIDGQTALTPEQRVALVEEMKEYSLWQVQPVKRIYIPKSNGKSRPLGIPTLANRVAQAIVKNALEPVWETRFEANSYGFRPGRSVQDAIAQCHIRLRQGNHCSNNRWVLDADIKGAFDNISHQYILDAIGELPGRNLIHQWLKAGYVESEILHPTTSGTPQGGVISPLLANIALDGIERLLKRGNPKSTQYGFVRYCDDFVVTARSEAEILDIQPLIQEWLRTRGLELNADKTNIVPVEQGFNFLGFHIRQFRDGCFTIPQKDKVLAFLKQIRKWLIAHQTVAPEAVISYLNPILRGWSNYYKQGASKRVFNFVDSELWKMLWQWSLRRHSNKGKRWVAKKYFLLSPGDSWLFKASVSERQGGKKIITLYQLSRVMIRRHIKVRGNASPDDPTLQPYWKQRRTQCGKSYWSSGSKFYNVAQNQQWNCPVCGEHLFNGEAIHTHHRIAVRAGGTNEVDNLVHLHENCHRQIHMGQSSGQQEGLSRMMGELSSPVLRGGK